MNIQIYLRLRFESILKYIWAKSKKCGKYAPKRWHFRKKRNKTEDFFLCEYLDHKANIWIYSNINKVISHIQIFIWGQKYSNIQISYNSRKHLLELSFTFESKWTLNTLNSLNTLNESIPISCININFTVGNLGYFSITEFRTVQCIYYNLHTAHGPVNTAHCKLHTAH